MFDPHVWAAVPFHFWTLVFFVYGCIVGSLLNVCIHRLPRGESIVRPPSHCPHCQYSIPWYLNIPFSPGFGWAASAPIALYFNLAPLISAVELLTGVLFAACWNLYGAMSAIVVLVYCLLPGSPDRRNVHRL